MASRTLKKAAVEYSCKCCSCRNGGLCVLAVFLSPLAVFIKKGCVPELGINILCFVLGIIPGIIHAWYVILKPKFFRRMMYSLLAIILPPLAVGLKLGCGSDIGINIVLTIIGFLPGIIHAIYCIWVKTHVRGIGEELITQKVKRKV